MSKSSQSPSLVATENGPGSLVCHYCDGCVKMCRTKAATGQHREAHRRLRRLRVMACTLAMCNRPPLCPRLPHPKDQAVNADARRFAGPADRTAAAGCGAMRGYGVAVNKVRKPLLLALTQQLCKGLLCLGHTHRRSASSGASKSWLAKRCNTQAMSAKCNPAATSWAHYGWQTGRQCCQCKSCAVRVEPVHAAGVFSATW